jgi:hypothetical protein
MSALGALVSRATAFFGPDYVRDRDSRIALMESHEASSSTEPDPFREMDEEFYRLLQAFLVVGGRRRPARGRSSLAFSHSV